MEVTGDEPQTLTAPQIVIATGSYARSVPGIEIDRARIITSDEAIALRAVPKSMVILGSGPIGVEFATVFRRFGSEVTVVELLPHLVPLEDDAISIELEKAFKKQGIAFHVSTTVTAARAGADGVDIDAKLPDGTIKTLTAEYLLVATGRGPVTSGLGAEEAGIKMDRGYIVVDEQFRTSVPNVSAVGDVITFGTPGHLQLAHLSTAEGIALAERLAGKRVPFDQLRPRAEVHLLRPGDRQRGPDREAGGRTGIRRAGGHLRVQRAWAGPASPTRPMASSRSWRRRSTTRCSAST